MNISEDPSMRCHIARSHLNEQIINIFLSAYFLPPFTAGNESDEVGEPVAQIRPVSTRTQGGEVIA